MNGTLSIPANSLDPFGHWISTQGGYGLYKLPDPVMFWYIWPITVYHVTMDKLTPLTLVQPDGTMVRIGPEFDCDDGSIPPFLQSIPGLSSNRFEWSYLFHNFACKYGGLFFRDHIETEFLFRRMTRPDVDLMLYNGIGAEGGNTVVRHTIYRGVRLYAPFMPYPEIEYWDQQPPASTGSDSSIPLTGVLKPA